MRKIILLLLTVIVTIQCSAQTKQINITELSRTREACAYYMDEDSLLDPFVGNWVYTDSSTSFTISLKKEIKFYNFGYYEDFLIGEYKYVKDTVVKISTLHKLDFKYHQQRKHEIDGNYILDNDDSPICNDCIPNEKRVDLDFACPFSQLGGNIILQKITVNGQPALKALKKTTMYFVLAYGAHSDDEMLVPDGEYILIKQ